MRAIRQARIYVLPSSISEQATCQTAFVYLSWNYTFVRSDPKLPASRCAVQSANEPHATPFPTSRRGPCGDRLRGSPFQEKPVLCGGDVGRSLSGRICPVDAARTRPAGGRRHGCRGRGRGLGRRRRRGPPPRGEERQSGGRAGAGSFRSRRGERAQIAAALLVSLQGRDGGEPRRAHTHRAQAGRGDLAS
jgi:hypothetical protein